MNEKKLKSLFGNVPESVLLINPLGQIIFSNPSANKHFGNRINRTLFHLVDAAYHAEIFSFLRGESAKPASRKKVLGVNKEGSLFPVSLFLKKIVASPDSLLFLVVINDLFKEQPASLQAASYNIVHGKHSIISLYDSRLHSVYVSRGYMQTLGYTKKEYNSMNFFDMLHEKDRNFIIHEFYDYISGKSTFNSYIYRFIHKKGLPVWVAGTIRTVIDEHENTVGFIVNHHIDFIHIKDYVFQPYFAKSSDEMLVLLDSDFHIEFISPASQSLLGYSKEELSSIDFRQLVHPEDLQKLIAISQQATGQMEVESDLVFQLRHKKGHYVSFEGKTKPFYNDEDEATHVAIQLKKNPVANVSSSGSSTEVAAMASDPDHQLYRSIFEQSKDAIFLIDTESTRVINCNLPAVRLFRAKDKHEFIGVPAEEFQRKFVQPEEVKNEDNFLTGGDAFDVAFLTCEGGSFWGDVAVMNTTYRESPVVIVQITDTTLRKQYERELLKAKETAEQIIKAQEKFLSTVSHEIRTPLNAVLGMTHLLMQGRPREDQLKLLETLKFSGENLITLINEILDYSKVEAGKLELEASDFNLKKFIQSIKLTYKNLANNKGLVFRLLSEEEIPEYVKGDITRLGQILNNLLSNAVKFTDKGKIVLSIYVEQEQDNTYHLLFEVSDTGIGIPDDKLETVFDPFRQASTSTTRHFGGTGLGLAIVKNLVELHGGKLSVESTVGEGTVFRVTLPFQKADIQLPLSNGRSEFIAEYQSLDGLKVLYVEDVLPNQFLMEGLADNWNIELDTALNGLEALEKVRQNKYDLILMDIQMPEMDGFETTQEIRNLQDAHYINIPIVALTASVSDTTREKIKITGMDDYISKPINPDDLHRKLSKFSRTVSDEKVQYTMNSNVESEQLRSADQKNHPDFSTLQNLYVNDRDNYRKILTQIRDLIHDTIPQIMTAIETGEEDNFRATSHNITSYIKLFKLNELEKVLLRIREVLTGGTKEVPEKLAVEAQQYLNEFSKGIVEELEKTEN